MIEDSDFVRAQIKEFFDENFDLRPSDCDVDSIIDFINELPHSDESGLLE